MKSVSLTTLLLALGLLAIQASAQISPSSVALRFENASGGSVGPFCQGFSCTILQTTVTTGDAITLRVTGQLGGAYLIALSLGQVSCLTVPGILNKLLIDPLQLQLMVPGTMNQPSPALACPSGLDMQSFVWPNIGPGVVFYLQAVSTGPAGLLAFTDAIQVTTT